MSCGLVWRELDHYGRRHVINPLAVHEFKSRWIAFSLYWETLATEPAMC